MGEIGSNRLAFEAHSPRKPRRRMQQPRQQSRRQLPRMLRHYEQRETPHVLQRGTAAPSTTRRRSFSCGNSGTCSVCRRCGTHRRQSYATFSRPASTSSSRAGKAEAGERRFWCVDQRSVQRTFRPRESSPAEVTAVILRSTDGQSLRVASVYVPPTAPANVDVWLSPLFSSMDVVAGDFNARHAAWCPTALLAPNCLAFSRGTALQSLVTAEEWSLNSDVSPPAATTVHGTAIDLFAFAQHVAATPVVALPSPSDHHFLVLLAPLASAPMVRRRVRATLWRRVTPQMLDRAVQLLPSLNGAVSAKDLESALRQILATLPSSPWLRSERTAPPLPTGSGPPSHTDADAWRMLKAEFRLPAPNTPLLDAAGRQLITPRQRARGFLRLYAAKHGLQQRQQPITRASPGPTSVTLWEVKEAMDCLNRRGCADDNGISPQLLLRLRPQLEPLFAQAFSRQLSAADPIPKAWHCATFIPLLKEDKPPNLLDSFRPVALTSLVCRLCERVVAARSLRSLRRPLHSRQFGFVPGRRAELVLAHLLDDALNGFESRTRVPGSTTHVAISHITYAAMVDLSDAFCRVLPQSVGLCGQRVRRRPVVCCVDLGVVPRPQGTRLPRRHHH